MTPDGNAEPRFDIDFKYGRQGELQIGDLLSWIAAGNGQVEVKRKRFLDLRFYVETECDKGRTGIYQPSGISVTTAAVWAFVIGDTGVSILIPTEELRGMLDDASSRPCEERDGSCPTRGKLVTLAVLLYRHKQRDEATGAPTPAPTATPARRFQMTPEQVDEFCERAVKADEIRWSFGGVARRPAPTRKPASGE